MGDAGLIKRGNTATKQLGTMIYFTEREAAIHRFPLNLITYLYQKKYAISMAFVSGLESAVCHHYSVPLVRRVL
ncbi:hypothetical protein CE91St56_13590 [Lachnospiraceae bacterium]|nr:hypothetical protein CE91St56_13590 [Lachnospiraceae bacterium]GKH40301.1 hypothetical protein CE91St57_12750 [Lachnospiraceae bacterium]